MSSRRNSFHSTQSGPRRLDASPPSALAARLRRLGLSVWAALVTAALILAIQQLAHSMPLSYWAAGLHLQALLPALIACAGICGLVSLGWLAPVLMSAVLTLGLALTTGPGLLAGTLSTPTAVSAWLLLPATALLLNDFGLRRFGFSGYLRRSRDLALIAGLSGVLLPAVSALGLALMHADAAAVLDQALRWSAALLAGAAVMWAAPRRPQPRRSWLGPLLAAAALTAQGLLALHSLPEAALLLPHLLLGLLGTRASARQTAGVALLMVLIGCAAGLPGAAVLGLGVLPLWLQAMGVHGRRERDAWRAALDAQGIALAEWRLPQGGVRASRRWLSLTRDESAASWSQAPLDWVRHVHPRDKDAVRRALRELLAVGARAHLSLQLRLAPDGGDWGWHELHAHVPQRDARGRARGLVATLTDVSARHLAEEREHLSAALFQHVQEGLAVIDSHWRVIEANPAYCQILGTPREALVGLTAAPLASNTLRRHGFDLAQIQAALSAGRPWQGQVQIEREGMPPLQLALRLNAVAESVGAGGQRWRVLGVNDLTEPLRQEERLRRLVRFDGATGLPNREEFMARMHLALNAARREGYRLVICVIDLDDFARLNAEHGQLVADAVLNQLAQRLQGALRSAPNGADQLARLFGDEFAVLLRVQDAEESLRAVERLARVLAAPVPIRESQVGDGLCIEVTASVGATLFPTDDSDPETLLRHASHALYRAKQIGRGSINFHDMDATPSEEAGLLALARIQRAFDAGELLLHYQPVIDLRSGQVASVEALLRWQHPERGLLPAAHFLPLVETTGLALQIGEWVIEQALLQAGTWLDEGRALAMNVNVGARQLRRADFPQRLQELLQRQRPEVAALLHLDILEADALRHTEAAQALVQRCLALGVGVALDDFGAGFSHLGAMKRLPVDTIKLSRQLVQGMLADAQDLSLVTSVIALARNMGCVALAKGVESGAHARELLRLGCRLGQGNAIAAAMPAAAVPTWVSGFASADWPARVASAAPPVRPPR